MSNEFKASVMTDEERTNPSSIFQRKEMEENSISVYFGSHKPELPEVCIDCKKRMTCKDYWDIYEKGITLKDATFNEFLTKKFTKEEIEKVRQNDFYIIKCINREV